MTGKLVFSNFSQAVAELRNQIDWNGNLVKSRLGHTKELLGATDSVAYPMIENLPPNPKHHTYEELWGPQVDLVSEILKNDKDSRQAIITTWFPTLDDNDDLKQPEVMPCWVLLQFIIRNNKLHILVYSRSQNIDLLPHDLKVFCKIQTLVAEKVGVTVGSLRHMVGSLHMYTDAT